MEEFSERADKVLRNIADEFSRAAASDDPFSVAEGMVTQFGITQEEFAELSARIVEFFTAIGIPILPGVMVSLLLGMFLGRDLDQELRQEFGLS